MRFNYWFLAALFVLVFYFLFVGQGVLLGPDEYPKTQFARLSDGSRLILNCRETSSDAQCPNGSGEIVTNCIVESYRNKDNKKFNRKFSKDIAWEIKGLIGDDCSTIVYHFDKNWGSKQCIGCESTISSPYCALEIYESGFLFWGGWDIEIKLRSNSQCFDRLD